MVRLSRLLYVYLVQYPPFIIFNLLQRLLYLVSPSNVKRPGSKGITSDWLASNGFLTAINGIMKVQAGRETELNGPVIDVKLFDLQNKTDVSLMDFMKENRQVKIFMYKFNQEFLKADKCLMISRIES